MTESGKICDTARDFHSVKVESTQIDPYGHVLLMDDVMMTWQLSKEVPHSECLVI